jgi:hypothetical protein
MLLREVREVAVRANPTEPRAVTQRAFDRARAANTANASLPTARQIAKEIGIPWPEVLAVALAPDDEQSHRLMHRTRETPLRGWLTSARITYALRLVAGRLRTNSLSRVAYDAERDVILNEDARDYLHGRRLRLPSANAITIAAHGWGGALRIAGLEDYKRRKRTINQVIVYRVEVMDRFYDRYEEQATGAALSAFARGNKIPMSSEGGRRHSEVVAEWRRRRHERGESEPRVVKRHRNPSVKAPDFGANVGAAKPGEYPHRGKWKDENLCVEWVAHYVSSRGGGKATVRDYVAWVRRNPGAATPEKFTQHGGWSAVLRKAEEQIKAQGPPTGPPTPGPSPTGTPAPGVSDDDAPSDDTGETRGS